MKFAITFIALVGLAYAQGPPSKGTPPGKQILDKAIAGIGKWSGPGSLQPNPPKSPKPPIKNTIGGLPELFKPKPGSSDWREDTLKGPRKKPGTVWSKSPSPKRRKREVCGPGPPNELLTGAALKAALAKAYEGMAGGRAIGIGVSKLVDAVPGASDKMQEATDSISDFEETHFGSGIVYLIDPVKYGLCEDVLRPDIHPNPEYRKELIRINCPPGIVVEETPETPGTVVEETPETPGTVVEETPETTGTVVEETPETTGTVVEETPETTGTVVEETPETPETPAEPPRQCFDLTGPIPCGGGQTEVQLDIGRAICGICGDFWNSKDEKCMDKKAALIWPSLTPITNRTTCADLGGSSSCGGGQTEAELDMGWAVCRVCSGFVWDPDTGKCTAKDGKLLWPHKS
ncbi:hypothetical protein MY3296_001486 [Beauveria thailandica]